MNDRMNLSLLCTTYKWQEEQLDSTVFCVTSIYTSCLTTLYKTIPVHPKSVYKYGYIYISYQLNDLLYILKLCTRVILFTFRINLMVLSETDCPFSACLLCILPPVLVTPFGIHLFKRGSRSALPHTSFYVSYHMQAVHEELHKRKY
jgi:hypothetical protein